MISIIALDSTLYHDLLNTRRFRATNDEVELVVLEHPLRTTTDLELEEIFGHYWDHNIETNFSVFQVIVTLYLDHGRLR